MAERWIDMKMQKKWMSILDKVSFVLLCVLMADCCITGAGRLVEIGAWGGRMILFFLLGLSTLPTILSKWKVFLKNRFVQLLILFWGILAIQAVRGVLVGNHRGILVTDVKGYIYFAMVPIAICVLNNKNRIHTLMKVMMYASFALGCVAIGYLVAYVVDIELFQKLAKFVVPQENTTTGMIAFTALKGKQLRVFCYSGLYLLSACAFSFYFMICEEKRKTHLWYCLITAVSLLVLLISFTRSVYFAVFVSVVTLVLLLLYCLGAELRAKGGRSMIFSILIFAVLLTGADAITGEGNLQYGITRILLTVESTNISTTPTEPSMGSNTESNAEPSEPGYNQITLQSDQLRKLTVEEYKKHIRRNVFFGKGLGVYLECRDDGYGEYFYLDMIAKMGIVGLFSFLAPVLMCIFYMIDGVLKKKQNAILVGIWIVPLLGLMGFSYFNPYMNAALGVLFYSLVIAVVSWYCEQSKN